VQRRRATALHRLDEVVEFAEVFLPDSPAFAVHPGPLGIVVVGVPMNLLALEPFHTPLLVPTKYFRA